MDEDIQYEEQKQQSWIEDHKTKSNDEIYDEWKKYIELRKGRTNIKITETKRNPSN